MFHINGAHLGKLYQVDGLASTLAPQSMRRENPLSVGIRGASGGRSTPLILPTITWPPTKMAPELPAETKAVGLSALYQVHSHHNGRILFLPDGVDGGSPVSMTSEAGTISICSFL